MALRARIKSEAAAARAEEAGCGVGWPPGLRWNRSKLEILPLCVLSLCQAEVHANAAGQLLTGRAIRQSRPPLSPATA